MKVKLLERRFMKRLLILLTFALTLGVTQAQSLTVWTHFQDESLGWLEQEVAGFQAAFGTKVELVYVPVNEMVQNLLLNAPEGQGPDLVVTIPHDQLGQLAEGGVLASMEQFATPEYLKDLTEQSRLAFTLNGQLYGLPMYVDGPALIVNRDLVPKGPNTFEELIATAQKLTTGDTFGFLQVQDGDTFYHNFGYLRGSGGYVFGRDAQGNLDPSDIGLANEGAVRGAELVRSLRYDTNLIPPGVSYDVMHGQFLEGAAAMVVNGPWAIPDYLAAGINLAVMPIPPSKDGTEYPGFIGVQGVVLNEFSDNKLEAANLAKWLIRADAQVGLSKAGGRIPASQSAAAQVSDDPVIAGFAKALAGGEPMPNIPAMGAVWTPMQTAFALILESPDSDIPTILQNAVSEIRGSE